MHPVLLLPAKVWSPCSSSSSQLTSFFETESCLGSLSTTHSLRLMNEISSSLLVAASSSLSSSPPPSWVLYTWYTPLSPSPLMLYTLLMSSCLDIKYFCLSSPPPSPPWVINLTLMLKMNFSWSLIYSNIKGESTCGSELIRGTYELIANLLV